MEALKTAIITLFEADNWLKLTANVAGGISFHEIPEKDPAYPYVAFYLSADYDHHAAGQSGDWRLQFSVFSDSRDSAQVNGILDHLMSAYNGHRLTVSGATNSLAPAIAARDAFKDEDRRWQGIMIFELTME
jgi:hypothetical protein